MTKRNKKMFKRMDKGKGSHLKLNKVKISITIAVLISIIVGIYSMYMNTGEKTANAQELLQNGRFAQGIKVNKVDIGGLTYLQAIEKLDPVEFQKIENFKMVIKLNNDTYEIKDDDINIDTDLEDTLLQAIVLGQNGDRGERRKELSKIKKDGREFHIRYTYDGDLMEQQLTTIQKETGMAAQDATVKIEGGGITYVEGKTGIKIDREKLEADISAAMDQNLEQFEINASTIEVSPSITVADLKTRLVKKATTTTEFKSSTSARVANVVKAANLLNGEMIAPGETFSINSVLGARTKENGWSVATAISSGKYIDDVGGGICQVSSTLYNSAVKAGLVVVERRPHTYPVAYLPAGQDAAISTGGPDLKLKNNYDFPIYIVAYASSSSKTLDIMIYGPKNSDGGTYLFKSKEIANNEPANKPKITENSNLFAGEYIEVKPRKNHISVERWGEYVIDGKVVRTNKLSNDSYSSSVGEYVVGPGTEIDSKTGKPKGKEVNESYLTAKRTTTAQTTTAKETQETTNKTTTVKTTTAEDSGGEE